MKRILSIITVFALLLTSCTGEQGPPGFDGYNGYDGQDGQDGVNFVGQSFERTISFTSVNNYQETLEIPLDIDLFESDMVLIYRLVGQSDDYDIWRLIPETVYTENGGEFQYNFEHNFDFVTIYLDAPSNFNFNSLLDSDRLDQIFRIVILPVDFVNSSNLDTSNFNDVMQYVQ